MSETGGFLHLDADGRWPGFHFQGLEDTGAGALELAALPLLASEPPPELTALPVPAVAAGVAVDTDGTLFWTATDRVMRHGGCDAMAAPLPCFGDQLRRPTGLALLGARRVLAVADAAAGQASAGRVVLIDVDSFQERGGITGFVSPGAVAAAGDGSWFVVDDGAHSVTRVDRFGIVRPGFWARASTEVDFDRPRDVATAPAPDGSLEVFVLDAGRRAVVVLDERGHHLRTLTPSGIANPTALAVAGDSIYLGDGDRHRLLRLRRSDGAVIGAAVGFTGPVAGLALDHHGGLWVHPGGDLVPLRLEIAGGHVARGVLWGGPVSAPEPRLWQRLRALGDPFPAGGHLRFYVHAASSGAPPPPPASPESDVPGLFDPPWRALAPDVADVRVLGAREEATRQLWIGVELAGDGRVSPRLEQLRLDFDQPSWSRHLPALYQDPRKGADVATLERFLALFSSFFDDVADETRALGRLFDPAATPADWLGWLAGWLGVELDESWPETRQRQVVAAAFEASAWRGTARGLRAALRLETGVEAHVQEPLAQTAWWALAAEDDDEAQAATSVLGATTVLVPVEPEGAVLGGSAVLGQSDLARAEDFGAPVWDDTAYRFSVLLYRGQLGDPRRLAAVRATIERDKPAHTDYQLCFIDPLLRIGFQATIGVDTLLGGGAPRPGRLGEGALVLGGEPPVRLGEGVRLGQTTRLEPTIHKTPTPCVADRPGAGV